MSVIVYDHSFNSNEWFVLTSFCVGILMVFLLPKRFPKKTTGIYLLCGVFFGFLFDHTLNILPVSFYDINDTSRFELMDFVSHLMYGPYCYLFMFLYDRWHIKPRFSLVYILAWSFISIGFEQLSVALGVFHYQNGFNIFYSFVIFLTVLSFWVVFYNITQTYGNKRFLASTES